MPVVINEIVIRTIVDTQPDNGAKDIGSGSSATRSDLEEAMLERLFEILQEDKER